MELKRPCTSSTVAERVREGRKSICLQQYRVNVFARGKSVNLNSQGPYFRPNSGNIMEY
jgi:hypothetical protein